MLLPVFMLRFRRITHNVKSSCYFFSHGGVPDEIRRKIGITPGLIRVSVGIENADDLVADFENALKVFD